MMLPAPIPENEAARLAALETLRILFTPAEERFDRITRLACALFGTEIALVSLVAGSCQWFKSAQGLTGSETSRESSFCGHAILGNGAMVIEDALQDSRFVDNPFVVGPPFIRFYAGQPLRAATGEAVGTLCVIDSHPRRISAREIEMLADLGAMTEAELRRTGYGPEEQGLIQSRGETARRHCIDPVTRAWNHEVILELLAREVEKARRGLPFCMLVLRADGLEGLPEAAHDEAMAVLASRIRRLLRHMDCLGRFDDRSFIVLLGLCNLSEGKAAALRMAELASLSPLPGEALRPRLRAGLAGCEGGICDPASLVATALAGLALQPELG